MSSTDLSKHFEAADKEKSGLIDFNGLQLMIHSMGKCDAFLARQFVHAINNSKEKKCSLAELQSKVDSVKSIPVATPPSVDQPDGVSTVPTSLSGQWVNELKSTMIIYSDSPEDGEFVGYYNSAVGDAKGWYPLVGRYDPAPDSGYGLTVGWTVQWNNQEHGNSHSNTVWAGQNFQSSQDLILTSWVLVSETTLPDSAKAYLFGKDEFVKTSN